MRIRRYRQEDVPAIVQVQRAAAEADHLAECNEASFSAWLDDPNVNALENAFVITDDDDELNTWGQAGTLEGIEGEIVGYTVVQLQQDQQAYHLLCRGAVHPEHRRRRAGWVLMIGARNRAHVLAEEFEFEAEEEGVPVYFEALFPQRDPGAAILAARCEMQVVDQSARDGLVLYRKEL